RHSDLQPLPQTNIQTSVYHRKPRINGRPAALVRPAEQFFQETAGSACVSQGALACALKRLEPRRNGPHAHFAGPRPASARPCEWFLDEMIFTPRTPAWSTDSIAHRAIEQPMLTPPPWTRASRAPAARPR